jgi:competence protein ComEA
MKGIHMKKLLIPLLFFTANVFATPVNINKADSETIASALKGIGAKKAEAITKYRTKHGEFKTVSDLAMIKGIGDKTIQMNKKDILLK